MKHPLSYHQFLVSRELGGAGLIALNLARDIGQRGHDVRIWLPGSGAASQHAERLGVNWRRFGLDGMTKGDMLHALNCLAVAVKLGRGPGVAHIHTPAVYRLLRPVLKRLPLKTVVHVHLEPSEEEIRWAFRDPPDLIVPCARYLAELVVKMMDPYVACPPVVPVLNAVDVERFRSSDRAAAKAQVGASPDRPLLLMLANLAPHKGQETAIKAVAELARRGRTVDCWLAGVERGGGNTYHQKLEDVATQLNVADRVRLLGFRSDGPDLLRAADFLLLPSTHEGLPLSILEAQATRVPVLAASTAGVPEVVQDGKTGFLIAADDALGYADRIAKLLDSPDLYGRIVDEAFRRVHAEHTWDTYSQRIWRLYEDVLAAPDQLVSRAA